MPKKQIDTNVIFDHLESSTKKIVVEQGGTRSGKTYNILLWIIFSYCNTENGKVITITRKTFPSTRATVMRDFIDILKRSEGVRGICYLSMRLMNYFLKIGSSWSLEHKKRLY